MIVPCLDIRHYRSIDFFLDIVGERTGHLQCMKDLPCATITNFQAPVVSQDKQKISVGRRALAHRSGDFHSIEFKRLPAGIQAVNHWQRTLGIPPDYLVLAIIEIANALIIRIWDTRNCRMCFRPGRADHHDVWLTAEKQATGNSFGSLAVQHGTAFDAGNFGTGPAAQHLHIAMAEVADI